MKKDDAMALRERLKPLAEQAAAKEGFPDLVEDGKFYHDEVDGVGRWAQRFSRPARWPHLGPAEGRPACPGLRYEVWYFQGKAKEEELWLLALVDADHGLEGLAHHLQPAFKTLIEGGKYARRYQGLPPLVSRFSMHASGIARRVPLKKAEDGLKQLLADSLKPLEAAFATWEGAEGAPAAFEAACGSYDPLAALKKRFS